MRVRQNQTGPRSHSQSWPRSARGLFFAKWCTRLELRSALRQSGRRDFYFPKNHEMIPQLCESTFS
jgi:hypothetical protein